MSAAVVRDTLACSVGRKQEALLTTARFQLWLLTRHGRDVEIQAKTEVVADNTLLSVASELAPS